MKYWYEIPELLEAYDNGRDFRGVSFGKFKEPVWFCNVDDGKFLIFKHLDLTGAKFSGCNLTHVIFKNCDLTDALFINANLVGAEFYSCRVSCNIICMDGANLKVPTLLYDNQLRADCGFYDYSNNEIAYLERIERYVYTEHQELVGYKIVESQDYPSKVLICELLIPSYAKRIVIENGKCRCDIAKVLRLYTLRGEDFQGKAKPFIQRESKLRYEVGKNVCADSYDDCIYIECSGGIHFFMTEQEARKFYEEYEIL